MPRKMILGIDFNNIVFTSYYGEKLYNSKGANVNAIKGFFFKLNSLIETFSPDYIICANDLSRDRTFRRKLFKGYKAQRKPADPDIINQMKHVSQLVSLLGYPFINNELYEADDVLGMVSRYANENDMDMVIVSTDRDLYQLVTDHTYIFSPKNKDVIDRYWLFDNYKLTPDQWIELKMLQGDRSDNIPGIPGVGEVTAVRLMQEYGSIENIYANLQAFKPGLRESLLKGKADLPLTRELVTIITDYTKIGLTGDMLDRQERYPDEIFNVIEELEIPTLHPIMEYSLLMDLRSNRTGNDSQPNDISNTQT